MTDDIETNEKARANELLREAGYHVDGLPEPERKGLFGRSIRVYKTFVAIVASVALAVVTNLLAFFALASAFAGARSDAWVRWYFGNGCWYFLAVTAAIAIVAYPRLHKLKLV